MKRRVFILLMLLPLGAGAFELRPPKALWQGILRAALAQYNAAGPYEIGVKEISGDLYEAVVFHDVTVRRKSPRAELARIKSIAVDVHWKALLEKRIEFQRVTLNQPSLTMVWLKDRTFNFATPSKASEGKSRFTFTLAPIDVVDGQIMFINQGLRPERRLLLQDINIKSQIGADKFVLKEAALRLGEGRLKAEGEIGLQPNDVNLELHSRNLALEQLASAVARTSPRLRLNSTADWKIKSSTASWSVQSAGTLEGSPLELTLHRSNQGALSGTLDAKRLWPAKMFRTPEVEAWQPVDAHLKGSTPSLSSKAITLQGTVQTIYQAEEKAAALVAQLNIMRGQGPFAVDIEIENHKMRLEGVLNWPEQHVQLRNKVDPKLISLFAPSVDVPKGGSLSLELDITQVRKESVVKGHVTGDIPQLKFGDAGLELKNIKMDVESTGTELTIHTFKGETDHGTLQIAGTSRLPDLNFDVVGSPLEIKKKKELEAVGHIQLHVGGNTKEPEITGLVRLEKTTYYAPDKKKQRKMEKERKKKQKETVKQPAPKPPTPPIWLNTRIDIQAPWPGRVWYRDGLTGIETAGDLRIQKARGETKIYLTGVITVVRGTAEYYGKRFDIEAGDLRFLGPPSIMPMLNLRATYRSDPTIIYLLVTGPADDVKLKLESNPPMPEQDILSVIVFGRPLSDMQNKGSMDAESRDKLTDVAGSVFGGYVAQGLHSTGIGLLEFDVVDIKPPKVDQGAQVTVGRYLGSRFFVSYGQEMKDNQRTFTAEYFLNRQLTLAGQSGSAESNRLDLLWRIPLNGDRRASMFYRADSGLPPNPNDLFDESRREHH